MRMICCLVCPSKHLLTCCVIVVVSFKDKSFLVVQYNNNFPCECVNSHELYEEPVYSASYRQPTPLCYYNIINL